MPSIGLLGEHYRRTDHHKHAHLDIHDDGSHQHLLPTHEPSHFLGLRLPNIFRWIPKHSSNEEPLISASHPSLAEKYGTCTEIIHYGIHSTVRIYEKHSKDHHQRQLYAVKVFRRSSVPSITSHQRLEDHISSSLVHPNICRTTDSLLNDRGDRCLVMNYYDGGDLDTLISTSGHLETIEADCFFKQILRAVSFLHANGIAHGDIKTENIILTTHGAIKLADFGCATLHTPNPKIPTTYSPRTYSEIPFLAPEILTGNPDPKAGDVWAVAMVYMAMRRGRLLWRRASDEDWRYEEYIRGRREEGFPPIEALGRASRRNVIYAMLHPLPHRRISAADVLQSEWIDEVGICHAGEIGL